jgi:AraC family transcriptional regulator, activator of mtrCDE
MEGLLRKILDTVTVDTTIYFRADFHAPYAIKVPPLARVARFHVLVSGECWVYVDNDNAVHMQTGDMVLVPYGARHILSCGDRSNEVLLEDAFAEAGYSGHGPFTYGNGDEECAAQMICGHFAFTRGADHPLLTALPKVLHVKAELRSTNPLLDEMIGIVTRHVFNDDPDAGASFNRISEALFIEILRASSHEVKNLNQLLTAISDPQIGRALAAIHENVGARWTVDSMANHAAMSRTRFAAKFHDLVGLAPMAYLTEWRLQTALRLLSDGRLPIKSVAAQVGYASAAAFSRAFTERFGRNPSHATESVDEDA